MKKLFFFFAASALILSLNIGCNSCGNQATDSTKVSNVLTVDSFMVAPEKWANKEVLVSGTVSHVCRHSGKKLFLFGADAEKTVKINAGGSFSTFDLKYEGLDVEITGTVVEDQKIDANYLNEWESDIKKMVADKDQKVCNEENKAISGQTNVKGSEEQAVEDPYADVKAFRKKLADSGKTYISVYAINCKTLKELKKK